MTGRTSTNRTRLRIVLVLAAIALIAVAAYQIVVFKPSSVARKALQSDGVVHVTDAPRWWQLEPAQAVKRTPSVIFYPGFLADTASYAPWARELAEAGHAVYLVKMPLHLSPLGFNRASAIMKAHPDETFVIGGHSLGGATAARFAANHGEQLAGVFLMASFVGERTGQMVQELPVLQIAASKDGIVPLSRSKEEHEELPNRTEYVTIRGGNHQHFASFAERWQDYPSTITEQEQLHQVATIIREWLGRIETDNR
ncbi:pimeloyl-ACP methyl ester carboxylesterase [Paenibacillus phyllosphaerae]|uniref:Pimeloyl-ACP methyl ester carboxylesterase n=1 Tax=Paenibacillus phyllosphaerae TaxID=274593 RepID=A0A7W5AT86_9BACL|nr:alpha/beta fold hydrolase [Paenibacillus phyllosphaerae]MBB3108334.1 pimeloyl-ACP methyl ester carboxylesterase [Paenibacillus phyllosphaerae]